MPNNEGNRYYWSLHSKNAIGENIGAVLDDLSDIEVTPEEELDDEHKAIIIEYDEDLGRNKFKLGAASATFNIEADENQVLIGDGENWAKGGAFNIEKFDNKNSGEPYEHWWALTARTEEYQDNLPQGIIIQGNKTKTFSKNPISDWGSMSFTSKLPYLALRDDSYCLFDNKAYVKFNDADVQITEKAQITIGGDGSQRRSFLNYPTGQYEYPTIFDGPTVHIHVPTFISIGSGRVNDCAGVVNFGGAYCFELTDQTSKAYTAGARRTGHASSSALKYKWGDATFAEYFDQIGLIGRDMCQDGPLLKFNGNPTMLAQGTPWFQMDDAPIFLMLSEAAFKMDNQATAELIGTSDLRMHSQSQIYVGDNFRFKGSYYSGIESGGWRNTTLNKDIETSLFATGYMDLSVDDCIQCVGGNHGRESSIVGASSASQIASRQNGFDQHSNIWFHNKGSLSYGSDASGATITTKVGGYDGSNSYYLIEPGTAGKAFVKFAPKNGTYDLIIDPDGMSYYTKISPKGAYKKIIEPNGNFQFTLQGSGTQKYIVEPVDAYVQVEGHTHIENHSGALIFRDNITTDAPLHARGIPLCHCLNSTSEEDFYLDKYHYSKITTEHQYSNDTISELNNYTTNGTSDYDIFKQSLGTNLIDYQEGVGNVNSVADDNGTYTTTILGFVGGRKSHNNVNWTTPIQTTYARGGNKISHPAPIMQMYDNSNFLMRAKEVPYTNTYLKYIYEISAADRYDMTNQNTADASFHADTVHYNIFQNLIPATWVLKSYKIVEEENSTGTGYQMTIQYKLIKEDQYTELFSDPLSPTFEMVGNSELRLWDGTMIKAKQGAIEAEFTFSDGTTNVTFTISELANLKRMASGTPTVVVDDSSEMTENDTLYFLNE